MSLSDNIDALAARIGAEIKDVRLNSSGGPATFFVGGTQPTATTPWVWFDTTGGNLQVIYEDGV